MHGGRKCSFLWQQRQGSSCVFSYCNKQNPQGKIHHKFCHSGEEILQKLQGKQALLLLFEEQPCTWWSCCWGRVFTSSQVAEVPDPNLLLLKKELNSFLLNFFLPTPSKGGGEQNQCPSLISDTTQSPCRMRSQEHWTQKPTTLTKPAKHVPLAFN